MILLFHDQELEPVLRELRRRREPHAVVDWMGLSADGDATLEVGSEGVRGFLEHGGRRVELAEVSCVYYSEPHLVRMAQRLDARQPLSERLAVSRWSYALHQLRAAMPQASWVPAIPAACGFGAQSKLSELAMARLFGLRVPETICTTDPEAARAFFRAHQGRIVFRDWASPVVPMEDGSVQYFPVALVDPDFAGAERVTAAPTVFQRFVEKRYDVRVVLVGHRVFAVKIDSQRSPSSAVDWRVYDLANVPFTAYRLPPRIEEALVALADRLELRLATIDLVRGVDGEHYFLEMNRPGGWAAFDVLAGLGISTAIADLLVSAGRAEVPMRRRVLARGIAARVSSKGRS